MHHCAAYIFVIKLIIPVRCQLILRLLSRQSVPDISAWNVRISVVGALRAIHVDFNEFLTLLLRVVLVHRPLLPVKQACGAQEPLVSLIFLARHEAA